MADEDKPRNPYPWTLDFELATLRQLIADPTLLPRVGAHLEAERFPNATAQRIVGEILVHWAETGERATRVTVLQRLQNKVHEGELTHDVVIDAGLLLEKASETDGSDTAFVRQQILDEARKKAVWDALDQGLRQFRTGDYEEIAEGIDRAVAIGRVDAGPGTDYGSNIAKRTRDRINNRQTPRIGTGVPELDDVIRGGLAPGELGVVLGAPKFGKSMFLNTVAHHSLTIGGTVVYYSLEMSESELVDRMDSAISQVPNNDQLRLRASYVEECVTRWFEDMGCKLFIKQFPSYQTTPRDLRSHLELMRVEYGVQPTMLVVDSADFCSPTVASKQGRYEDAGQIYSELKGIGTDWRCPVWTGSWAKRDSLAKKIVTMGDVAESFKKVGVADLGVAICGTEDEREAGLVRLYTAFCRYTSANEQLGPFRNNFECGLMAKGGKVDDDD